MSLSKQHAIAGAAAGLLGAGVLLAIGRQGRLLAKGKVLQLLGLNLQSLSSLAAAAEGAGAQALADSAVEGLPHLEANLKFKAGTHEAHAKADTAPTLERATIYDARGAESRFTLDDHGFALVRAPTYDPDSIDMYESPEAVRARLYPLMEKMLLAELPGATRVLLFDHIIRNKKRLESEMAEAFAEGTNSSYHEEENRSRRPAEIDARARECEATARPKTRFLEVPLGHVHGDYTVRSGHTRARQLLDPYCTEAEIEAALGQRFAIVNVWHPIGPQPVRTDPLSMCVWGSFTPRDVMTKRLTFPHRIGETYQALFTPAQRWVYYSGMSREEAILLKTFDSIEDGKTARFSIHSAFRLPEQDEPSGAALPVRESMELRALVFYGKGCEGLAPGFVNPSLAGDDAPLKAREQAKLVELELYNLVKTETLPPGDAW